MKTSRKERRKVRTRNPQPPIMMAYEQAPPLMRIAAISILINLVQLVIIGVLVVM